MSTRTPYGETPTSESILTSRGKKLVVAVGAAAVFAAGSTIALGIDKGGDVLNTMRFEHDKESARDTYKAAGATPDAFSLLRISDNGEGIDTYVAALNPNDEDKDKLAETLTAEAVLTNAENAGNDDRSTTIHAGDILVVPNELIGDTDIDLMKIDIEQMPSGLSEAAQAGIYNAMPGAEN